MGEYIDTYIHIQPNGEVHLVSLTHHETGHYIYSLASELQIKQVYTIDVLRPVT